MSQEGSLFHDGERAVQQRAGARGMDVMARGFVVDYLPAQHRDFHSRLPFLVAAARDGGGRPWVTVLEGDEGFVSIPDPRRLDIAALPPKGDALDGALRPGADIGLLGIELATRRRNRLNASLTGFTPSGISLSVVQAFGNCPQYITQRDWKRVTAARPGSARRSDALSASQRGWIGRADTFFIGTGYGSSAENPALGMDASHRGGAPGFVRVLDQSRLRFPDYAGNNLFNTLGNLTRDPRVGLLFLDFASGGLLQITGEARIDWQPDADEDPAARRFVTVDVHAVVENRTALSLRWEDDAEALRQLRVAGKIRESEDVTSFVLEPLDEAPLAPFRAGQHLPIELVVGDPGERLGRTYSLSGPPSGDSYRITVKREAEGRVSRHLHHHIDIGSVIEARAPAGEFQVSCGRSPLVLVSAGIGITPMISMLHAVAAEGGARPVWFVHGARDGLHYPLAAELREIAARHPTTVTHIRFSRPGPGDEWGVDYHAAGRITPDALRALRLPADAHYFLCGPPPFLADIRTGLAAQGVPAERIHVETFGPAG